MRSNLFLSGLTLILATGLVAAGAERDARLLRLDELAAARRAERLAHPQKHSSQKKLIANGWDRPTPAQLRKQVARLAASPFDGAVIKLEGAERVFQPDRWDERDLISDLQELAATNLPQHDTFIWIDSASDLDWYSDRQWNAVLDNTRLIATAALLARSHGILFDPECYGDQLWSYRRSKKHTDRPFEEFETRVAECGEQWIRAVQEVCPQANVLTLFWTGCDHLVVDFPHSTGQDTPLNLNDFPDRVRQMRKQLPNNTYSLLPAFMNGMLRGIDRDSSIINGNEGAYYYSSRDEYLKYREYHRRYLPLAFIDEGLRGKYARVARLGSSYYADYYYGDFPRTLSNHMARSDQSRWTEHNVYWALSTSDGYVWEWIEGDWGRPFNRWRGYQPPGYEQTLRSAKDKVAAGDPLGFRSEDVFVGLRDRMLAQRPTAELTPHVKDVPAIDGQLDEEAWRHAYSTVQFRPQLDWTVEVTAPTKALICTDLEHIYVAFVCVEPALKGMRAKAKRSDDHTVLKDDNVQVLITVGEGRFPVYRFCVNTDGVLWDYRCNDSDWRRWAPYDAKWRAAVRSDDDRWIAEVAIPWQALGISSPAGKSVQANFYRHRSQGPQDKPERTSWAPTWRWFSSPLEPKYFGWLHIRAPARQGR